MTICIMQKGGMVIVVFLGLDASLVLIHVTNRLRNEISGPLCLARIYCGLHMVYEMLRLGSVV